MMRLKRRNDKSELMLMLNTVLFGTGAGLVSLAWMQSVGRHGNETGILNALFNLQEPLLLMTVAILLGGVFHSFTILYPVLVVAQEKRQKALNEANDYRDQAHKDPLTGLHNRRFFDSTLDAYFREFGRLKLPFGLLIFDVDHFKAVNDKHGHAVGDMVLQEIADCTRSLTREHDVVARIGGEEFAVILANVNAAQLNMVAERYRERVETLMIEAEREMINPTISIGTALSSDFENTLLMLEAADERLYVAKDLGRNQVVSSCSVLPSVSQTVASRIA